MVEVQANTDRGGPELVASTKRSMHSAPAENPQTACLILRIEGCDWRAHGESCDLTISTSPSKCTGWKRLRPTAAATDDKSEQSI